MPDDPPTLDYAAPDDHKALPWWIVVGATLVLVVCVMVVFWGLWISFRTAQPVLGLIVSCFAAGIGLMEIGIFTRRDSRNSGAAIVLGALPMVVLGVALVAKIVDAIQTPAFRSSANSASAFLLAIWIVAIFITTTHAMWVRQRRSREAKRRDEE